MPKRDLVINAINFDCPERIPVMYFNRDKESGDILIYNLALTKDDGITNEWGYTWKTLDDGTMGQPEKPVIIDWSELKSFEFPPLLPQKRAAGFEQFKKSAQGQYLLGSIGLTGFTAYTFLRGFSNTMMDLAGGERKAFELLDIIFAFEMEVISLCANLGLDGVYFGDDWGTQNGLFISPQMWRDIFKSRYKRQFDHAHGLGLHVWFHCCGNIELIVPDFHEIGVDVMNISQPNVVDIPTVGKMLRGKQCFMVPISYQTVSITGTPGEIEAEAQRLYKCLGTEHGGFIGYVEEYGCMGMSEENYQACISSFRKLK